MSDVHAIPICECRGCTEARKQGIKSGFSQGVSAAIEAVIDAPCFCQPCVLNALHNLEA